MNPNEYKQYIQQRNAIEEEIVSLAIEYAKLFSKLSETDPLNQLSYDDVKMTEDLISIGWTYYGSYQSEDKGVITVDPEILLGTKENWKPAIEKCIKEEQEKLAEEKKIQKEKEKQEEITKAMVILKKHKFKFIGE
jgi:hypothetical protein